MTNEEYLDQAYIKGGRKGIKEQIAKEFGTDFESDIVQMIFLMWRDVECARMSLGWLESEHIGGELK